MFYAMSYVEMAPGNLEQPGEPTKINQVYPQKEVITMSIVIVCTYSDYVCRNYLENLSAPPSF